MKKKSNSGHRENKDKHKEALRDSQEEITL
jgi:hypothetical protein